MIRWMSLLCLLAFAPPLCAQEKIPPRFGVEADVQKYPQANPKDTLRSVLKAIEAKRIDYMLAHLAEPEFVDKRVKDAGNRFQVMVDETTEKLDKNPESIREMRRFLSDGEWPSEPAGDTIEVKCKEVQGKQLFLKKIGNRWFLDNRTHADKDK